MAISESIDDNDDEEPFKPMNMNRADFIMA
jgi:hypothetical protein